jgi:predicted Zn finger-like uncharacterized protein
MLFTRCPDCHTNFRITASALRQADGRVCCGRCNAVFLAYDGLRERQPDAEIQLESSQATQRVAENSAKDTWSSSPSFVVLEDEDLAPAAEVSPAQRATAFGANMTAAQVDAALSDDLDIESQLAALKRGSQVTGRSGTKSVRWLAGSGVLVVLLTLQATHQFRAELVNQPGIGSLVRSGYSALGSEITPNWNLGQYEILDWIAMAEPGTASEATLTVTARIRNNGPAAQPYPSIRLELRDRWEQTVASRVFAPTNYLPPDHGAEGLMAAGTTVPARLEVLDRNEDAYGFELDVCVEAATGTVTCVADVVFN